MHCLTDHSRNTHSLHPRTATRSCAQPLEPRLGPHCSVGSRGVAWGPLPCPLAVPRELPRENRQAPGYRKTRQRSALYPLTQALARFSRACHTLRNQLNADLTPNRISAPTSHHTPHPRIPFRSVHGALSGRTFTAAFTACFHSLLAASSTRCACGETGSVVRRKTLVRSTG